MPQSESTNIVAIEIASSKVRAAIGQVQQGSPLTVTAVVEESLPTDIVRYGVIRNVEKVANALNRILHRLATRVSPRDIKSVYVAIGGRSVSSSERCVERQLPEETEITPRLIEELNTEAQSMGPAGLPGVDDVVASLPRAFTIDGLTTPHPVGVVGRDITACFVIVAAQEKLRKNIERVVAEKLGLEIVDYVVRPIAVADFVLSPDERSLGCMLVDFGAETTTVSIYKNGRLQFLSTLPIGSRNITRDIMALPYLEEQAETLKRSGGNAAPKPGDNMVSGGVDFSQINNYVSARASEIIINIRAQLSQAGLTAQELPKGIVVVGGGSKLRGFTDRLAELTKMRVRLGLPSSHLRVADSSIAPGELIDIISVLLKAAESPEECLSALPEPEEPAADTLAVLDEPDDSAKAPAKRSKPKKNLFTAFGNKIVELMKGPGDLGDDDDEEYRDD